MRSPLRRHQPKRLALVATALLTLTVCGATGPETAQALPAQSDQARVEVRTWSNAPAHPQPRPISEGGVLLDTTSAEVLLTLSGLGATVMAVRSMTRREQG